MLVFAGDTEEISVYVGPGNIDCSFETIQFLEEGSACLLFFLREFADDSLYFFP